MMTGGFLTHASPDLGALDPVFLRQMLAQLRDERPKRLVPLSAGITDVRLFRLTIGGGATAMKLTGTNAPPQIVPIPTEYLITEGATLVLTNRVTDPDLPFDAFTFMLGADAPPTVSLNVTNGVLTWTPHEGEGPSTNTIQIIVRDDGSPHMLVTNTLTIAVLESNLPPALGLPTPSELTAPLEVTQTQDYGLVPNLVDLGAGDYDFDVFGGAFRADGNSFAHQTVTGDFDVRVCLQSFQLWSAETSAGLMVREFLDAGSRRFFIAGTEEGTGIDGRHSDATVWFLQYPVRNGELKQWNWFSSPSPIWSLPALYPEWMRIRREGQTFIALRSADGTNWVEIARETVAVPYPQTIQVGLFGCSGDYSHTALMRFRSYQNLVTILAPASDHEVLEGQSLFVQWRAADPDLPLQPLTFSLDAGAPPGAAIDPVTGLFSWTPARGQAPSTNLITVRVTDDGAPPLSATQTFRVIVTPLPPPPEFVPIPPQTVNEGELLTVTNQVSAAYQPVGRLVFSFGTGAPTNAVLNPTNGIVTWTPSEAQGPGTNFFSVVVADDGMPEQRATNEFTVVVLEVNSAPALAPIADQTITEGATLSLSLGEETFTTPGLWREVYLNLPGTSLGDLTNAPAFPDQPDQRAVLTGGFEAPRDVGEDYGQRLRGWLLAPQSGDYRFWIASDDASALFLSTDAEPAHKRLVASVVGWTGFRQWTKQTNQTSDLIRLEAGRSYYVEALMKEGGGGDHLSVQWQLPGGELETPIPSTRLCADRVASLNSDADYPPQRLTFSLGPNTPDGVQIDPLSGRLTWTPGEAQGPSTNVVTVVLNDDGTPSLSATQSFTVVVLETNSAPALPTIADHSINELTLLTVTNTATDTDLPANTLTYALENPPAGAAIDADGIITWTPSEAQGPGVFTLTTIVTDSGSPALQATNSFTVTVNELNTAPVLPAQTNRAVSELTLLTVTNTAADADLPANTLTYALENPPAGAAIDADGIITWTPTETQGPGAFTLTTIVTDSGSPALQTTNSFTVTVNEVNAAPVLPEQTNRTVSELVLLTVTNTATDADLPANALSYMLENPPAGAAIDTNGIITLTPSEAQGPGVFTLTTIVADNGSPQLKATNSFTVTVNEVNAPPALAAIADRTTNPGQTVSFTAAATDTDLPANTLTFSLVSAPASAAINPSTGQFTWRPPVSRAGTSNYVLVRVTDNGTPPGSDTKGFAILVNPLTPVSLTPLGAAGGQFEVQVASGTIGPDYVLQGSTDLATWLNLRTNTPAALPFTLADPNAGTLPLRFYRVKLEP